MEYLSIKQTAKKWNLSTRRINVLCLENRIPGAAKIGSYWSIPADEEKPKDERIKSGRYLKKTCVIESKTKIIADEAREE